MPAVNATILKPTDSSIVTGAITGLDGKFEVQLAPGNYVLRLSFVGYETINRGITIGSTLKDLGTFQMSVSATTMSTVNVEAVETRAIQKNDTTELNAGAFKVNPDASAEDLVTKMPGITTTGGKIQSGGEDVAKVLIDGKEFFGDDPSAALRNLPAEVIDKVQVFDRMSDQSQFTGFNDGNTQKTINIITKSGKNAGSFGRFYAGYGTNNRYNGGLVYNKFKGAERISIIGMANNINQQNFSFQDILGSTGGGGSRGGGRGSRGGGGIGGDIGNFLVGNQGGINVTNSLGINYSNSYKEKMNLTASLFYNNTQNATEQNIQRTFLTGTTFNQEYFEQSDANTNNHNLRFNARIEYKIDSNNSLIFTPRGSIQDNSAVSNFFGNNLLDGNTPLNNTATNNVNNNLGYQINNGLLFQHRFSKPRRTISLSLENNLNNRDGLGELLSTNRFFLPNDSTFILDQENTNFSRSNSTNGSLNYTEPLGKNSQLQINYSPSIMFSESEKITYNYNTISDAYNILDTLLTNTFDNRINTQKGGFTYYYRVEKFDISFGAEAQNLILQSNRTFPGEINVEKPFFNILPNARIEFRPNKNVNIRTGYRTNTNTPNITQLQDVIDNTNPLQLTTGNPDLKQEYRHRVFMRASKVNTEKGKSAFIFLNATLVNDYISNTTLIARNDTLLTDGVTLNQGAQFIRPENLGPAYAIRSFFNYSMPIKRVIKSNFNLNGGVTYSRNPGRINFVDNIINNTNLNAGFVWGSNISTKIDFTLNYSGNYNIVRNSNQPNQNSNFFQQISGFKINYMPTTKWVFNTDLNNNLFTGYGEDFNQNFFLWNAGVGRKFLKNNAGEIRLTVFDILNQNNSITRTVTDLFIEDNRTLVLSRYAMLTFTYNLRKFKAPEVDLPPGVTPEMMQRRYMNNR